MFKTMTVYLHERVKTGVDALNRATYELVRTPIDGVLIAPVSSDDIVSEDDLTTKKAVYTLAIPKGDNHSWTDGVVEFWGSKWHVVGIPAQGIEENIPLLWNKKVMVEHYE